MKRAVFIPSIFGAAALLAVFYLAVAYLGLAAWGNIARDATAVALFIATTVSLIASAIGWIVRYRMRTVVEEKTA